MWTPVRSLSSICAPWVKDGLGLVASAIVGDGVGWSSRLGVDMDVCSDPATTPVWSADGTGGTTTSPGCEASMPVGVDWTG